ncbi:hypothetical protein ABZX93_33520 [Streptomyces sp. NPDC006632]|uniref:hypothetical protein n=1 Tax=Streptomyces sp. NPDC006632 TaxID=3157182 RepID=UPI0033B7F5E8
MVEEVAVAAEKARPKVVNGTQLADELGIDPWMVTRALELGIIPPRDTSKGWSREAADALAPRVEEIREGIADREGFGARRTAELLAELTGLEVESADVPQLAEKTRLRVVDQYKGWDLYSVRDARALAVSDDAKALMTELITARQEAKARSEAEWTAWVEVSLPPDEAAGRLGWKVAELKQVAQDGRISAGRGGRFAVEDLDVLAADEELCETVTGDRLIRADEAAGLLEIRHPTDWQHVVAAGWITPASHIEARVGKSRWIDVPLFRTRDVEGLRDLPGVPWEEVRAVRAGEPSPLREYSRVTTRAEAIHAFAAAVADRHQVEVWAFHDDRTGAWALDWTRDDQDGPTREQVAAELRADQQAARYRADITVGGTRWGQRARHAREILTADTSVLLCTRSSGQPTSDTETTEIIEIAVVDASTGKVLLDRRVKPSVPLGERYAGGLTDEDLADASPWERVLVRVRDVTRGRLIVPGRPGEDQKLIAADTARAGKRPMHLAADESWALREGDDAVTPVRGLAAMKGCEYVREELLRRSRARGRAHLPEAAPRQEVTR